MEQRTLWTLIQKPEEQIHQLDEEISRLQAKRKTLKQFVDLHHALLSPFRRVPADIWRSIFIKCVPSNPYGLCTRTTKDAPLLLTTVCRSWREIAFSTPNLWTSIHIYLPAPSIYTLDHAYIAKLRGRREGLKAWLDRSGSLPLTISLGAEQMQHLPDLMLMSGTSIASEEARNAQRIEFTELLSQYSRRWETVAFSSEAYVMDLTPFERLPASSLTSLGSIYSCGPLFRNEQSVYYNVNPNHDHSLSPVANLLTRAHSLQRLNLFQPRISTRTLSLLIPWHHFIELSITGPMFSLSLGPGQLLQALNWDLLELQKLRIVFLAEILKFDHHSGVGDVFSRAPSIGFVLPGVTQIFDSVTLPSLTKLSVGLEEGKDSVNSGDYDAKLPFEDLLQRSQCQLTHFEMSNPRIITAERLISVLRQLKVLVSLNLGYRRPTESDSDVMKLRRPIRPRPAFLNRIVQPAWKKHWLERVLREFLPPGSDVEPEAFTSPLCPRLEEFNLGGCDLEDADVLLDFATEIPSRRANLRVFRAHLGWVLQNDVWKIFDSLRVQRKDSEEMRVVQDMGGMMFSCRWGEKEEMKPVYDTPTIHLPTEGVRWEDSLWW
ncbi:hypothetical protein PQX77_003670 [Marasmius sp. AFHP31]|nr:hypothetical protein PQX77_003670 [Marasmius sp. AFHP31]